MRTSRVIIAGTTLALTVSMGVLLPAGTASAWHRECVPAPSSADKEHGPFTTTVRYVCGEVMDSWDTLPPTRDGADPGAGVTSGGRGFASPEPGTLASCLELENTVEVLQQAYDNLVGQAGAIASNLQRHESDLVTNLDDVVTASNRTAAAEADLQSTIDDVVAAGGEVDTEFNERGKPINANSPTRAASRRVTAARHAEAGARRAATDSAKAVNDSRDSLARVVSRLRDAERDLLAALTRQQDEKCNP